METPGVGNGYDHSHAISGSGDDRAIDISPVGAVPLATPSKVERAGGRVKPVSRAGMGHKQGRPKSVKVFVPCTPPLSEEVARKSLRMGLLLRFMAGELPGDPMKRLMFLKACDLMPQEKAYLIRHEWFRDMYDARLFDLFMGAEELTREAVKIMDLIGRRVGLSRATTQVNVQVNNNREKDKAVTIQVQKPK